MSDPRTSTPTTIAGSGVFPSLYSLILRTQATRGRIITLGVMGLIGILLAVTIASANESSFSTTTDAQRAVDFIDGFGLSFLVPITALVFAAASLGDFREDGSLVYLWLRPVPRWKIIAAALATSITVTLPLVTVPLVVASVIVAPDAAVVAAVLASVVVAAITYTAVFMALGLRTNRALLWGLVYVLLWEGFISRAGGAARLSVSNYTRSMLMHLSDTDLELAHASLTAGYVVPLVVAGLAFVYACRRFQRQDVA
jgi:ABC-2 type transport system permease protein